MIPMAGMPETCNPQMATTTVNPANSTAWPAVALALAAAACTP
jgi:hypothetical protein